MDFSQLTPEKQNAIKKELTACNNIFELVGVLEKHFETKSIKLGMISKQMIITNLLNQKPALK